MDGTLTLATDPPAALSPVPASAPVVVDGIDWFLLRRLAADTRFKVATALTAKDTKPSAAEKARRCPACGVKAPGGPVCGYCRGRVRLIREEAPEQHG